MGEVYAIIELIDRKTMSSQVEPDMCFTVR